MTTIQFVPTFHWWDVGPLVGADTFDLSSCTQTEDLGTYYCYNRFNATVVDYWCYDIVDGVCQKPTSQSISELITNFGGCMQHAVDLGFDITLNVHVDDGRQLGGWRNTLDFDPLETYGGTSYLESVLYPLVDSLASAVKSDSAVSIVLQGEMGATVFMHPDSWLEVKTLVEKRISDARSDLDMSKVLVGLGLNNNKLCGCIDIGQTDGTKYLAAFAGNFEAVEGQFDLAAIQDLFLAYDFVGISAYVPMTNTTPVPCEFEGLMIRLDYEFSYYGLTLRDLSNNHGKGIQWIEFGIGGGYSQAGIQPAPNASWAAYYPFFGVANTYACDLDPFDGCDPNADNAIRDYRRTYYSVASQYLAQGGCSYRVSEVYNWNLQSWDPQGIYPVSFASQTDEERNPTAFQDKVIQQLINEHNINVTSGDTLCSQSLDTSASTITAQSDGSVLIAASGEQTSDDADVDADLDDATNKNSPSNLLATINSIPGIKDFVAQRILEIEGISI